MKTLLAWELPYDAHMHDEFIFNTLRPKQHSQLTADNFENAYCVLKLVHV